MSEEKGDDWFEAPNPLGLAGFEFLEFATYTEEERDELVRAFRALGFIETSRHRLMDVTRFNQGAINLVLNREPDCFARSFAMVHGASICAMGLRVADAKRAFNHATSRGAQVFAGTGKPGELAMPAIRGVFGSLIYYVDIFGGRGSVYDEDFRPVPGSNAKATPVGLDRIDHVSITVLPGRTAKWIDFFKEMFGFHDWSHNILHDPGGTVVSNVVSSPCNTIHFPINESSDSGTSPNRFLTEYFGEGIQHIAFHTDDIFATVRAMEANGLSPLRMPARFYDDLAAGGEHAPEFVEELRAHNILVDTEGGGQFLHAYTHPICNRFFFEVVQRKDYAGFGKGNAGVRLEAMREAYGPQDEPVIGPGLAE